MLIAFWLAVRSSDKARNTLGLGLELEGKEPTPSATRMAQQDRSRSRSPTPLLRAYHRFPTRWNEPTAALISCPAALRNLEEIMGHLNNANSLMGRLALVRPFPGGWSMALQALPVVDASFAQRWSWPHVRHVLEAEMRALRRSLRHRAREDQEPAIPSPRLCPRHRRAGQEAGRHRFGEGMVCGCCAGTCEQCDTSLNPRL